MEENTLHHFSLFLDSPLYVLPDENLQFDKQPVPYEEEKDMSNIEEAQAEPPELVYDGGFEKGVLVALDEKELNADLKELLFRILDAVGCSLKDIALCGPEELATAEIAQIEALNPLKVIVFGQPQHPIMQLKKSNYEIHMIDDTEYLFADRLELIAANKEMKKSLWASLKTLFNVS
jgi:hypothetical protein